MYLKQKKYKFKQKKYWSKCFIFKEIRAGMQVGGTYMKGSGHITKRHKNSDNILLIN